MIRLDCSRLMEQFDPVEPPGDTSYILGPMISMWYAWANTTQIGYVRQSDRKMVNLGRISGET